MNLQRLLFGLGLALVLVGQTLHAQQSDADRNLLAELRAKAEKGDAESQLQLGWAFRYGHLGLVTNYVEAVKWFRKAAEQGDAGAQGSLGLAYELGEGVAQDYAKAAKWNRRAAEQGDAWAQQCLGALFANGQGVPQNDIEAYKWASLAAAQGIAVAAKMRDLLAQLMARGEVVEAQRRAAAFVARKDSPGGGGSQGSTPRPGFAGTYQKASGTAFFVSEDGYLVSNFHVIEGASRIRVKTSHGLLAAEVVKTDRVNDVALLKVSGSFGALPLASSREGRQGQPVFTVGFPNIDLQGIEPKLTKGEISSLSGVEDDPRQFQISVAVQPGNSGGPLVDAFGNVIGIVTARLSEAAALETSGALPQNVNYATKVSYALPLLESVPGLAGKLKPPHPAKDRKLEDVADEARNAVALVLIY
ncbi:MAG: tetratricopeptide repeat-containing serine protease family protein [Verrucomicrobiota bacterium]|jgi:TPR repeat protein